MGEPCGGCLAKAELVTKTPCKQRFKKGKPLEEPSSASRSTTAGESPEETPEPSAWKTLVFKEHDLLALTNGERDEPEAAETQLDLDLAAHLETPMDPETVRWFKSQPLNTPSTSNQSDRAPAVVEIVDDDDEETASTSTAALCETRCGFHEQLLKKLRQRCSA